MAGKEGALTTLIQKSGWGLGFKDPQSRPVNLKLCTKAKSKLKEETEAGELSLV